MSKRKGIPMEAKRIEWHVPVVVTLKVETDEGEAIVEKAAVLPFLPRRGDELGVGPGGDYIRVDRVYWCEDDGVTVWFEDDDAETHGPSGFRCYGSKVFLADGWKHGT